jgi:GNAT superfamily N-acetyltransferase
VAVRPAGADDAVLLADLNHPVQALHHERVPEWFPAPGDPGVADRLRRWLDRADGVGFVAELDGRPVGYALASVHHRPATGVAPEGHWIDLDQIAVVPAARRRGVARGLCRRVIAHARELGLDEVRLNVVGFGTDAQALFASLGFEIRSQRLALRTGEPGGPRNA